MNKITARQFCHVCRALNDLEVSAIAELFVSGTLPEPDSIFEEAEAIADSITPSVHTAAAHGRMVEVAEWAAEGLKR